MKLQVSSVSFVLVKKNLAGNHLLQGFDLYPAENNAVKIFQTVFQGMTLKNEWLYKTMNELI